MGNCCSQFKSAEDAVQKINALEPIRNPHSKKAKGKSVAMGWPSRKALQGDRDIVVAAVKKFNGSNPTDRPVILAALSKLGTVSDRRMAGFSLRVFFFPSSPNPVSIYTALRSIPY